MTLPPSDDSDTKLLADLGRLTGAACPRCGRPACGHEALFSVAMGFKDSPHCLGCLAAALDWSPPELRDHLAEHFERRACYRTAWRAAGEREGFGPERYPACLWPPGGDEGTTGRKDDRTKGRGVVLSSFRPVVPSPESLLEDRGEEIAAASSWDAGDMACGDLVLALRGRMNTLPPGAVLKVTARDPAAPEDLPAWCRLTGHRLLRATHPDYYLQRKES